MNDPIERAFAKRTPEALPAGLADRITAAAVSDFRFRRNLRIGVRATACVMVAVTVGIFAWPKAKPIETAFRSIIDPFRETNQLLTSATKVELPTVSLPDAIAFTMPEQPTERFLSLPEKARTSLDPVAAPVTRAANRWAKEFGSAFAIPKPRM